MKRKTYTKPEDVRPIDWTKPLEIVESANLSKANLNAVKIVKIADKEEFGDYHVILKLGAESRVYMVCDHGFIQQAGGGRRRVVQNKPEPMPKQSQQPQLPLETPYDSLDVVDEITRQRQFFQRLDEKIEKLAAEIAKLREERKEDRDEICGAILLIGDEVEKLQKSPKDEDDVLTEKAPTDQFDTLGSPFNKRPIAVVRDLKDLKTAAQPPRGQAVQNPNKVMDILMTKMTPNDIAKLDGNVALMQSIAGMAELEEVNKIRVGQCQRKRTSYRAGEIKPGGEDKFSMIFRAYWDQGATDVFVYPTQRTGEVGTKILLTAERISNEARKA